jgi:hypothetical protein
MRTLTACILSALVAPGCATLGPLASFIQPPRFEPARDRAAEVRLVAPSLGNTLGGANIRLWTKVSNPNRFGFTLASLSGTLFLDETRAVTSEFPLGIPLAAGGEDIIPIDISINFAELPGLANVVRSALAHQPIAYRFDGTVGVEAGRLGTPVFGPMTLLSGTFD